MAEAVPRHLTAREPKLKAKPCLLPVSAHFKLLYFVDVARSFVAFLQHRAAEELKAPFWVSSLAPGLSHNRTPGKRCVLYSSKHLNDTPCRG